MDILALELGELARGLRQVGDTDLLDEVRNAIQDAAAPIPDAIRSQLPERLPDRYAEVLAADLIISTRLRTGRSRPGVSIVAPERVRGAVFRRRLIRLNQGVLEHPLFGNRRHWYPQTDGVTPGFFTQPAEDSAPRVRKSIEDALDRVKDKIFKGVHG
jgi:hypothetical protein